VDWKKKKDVYRYNKNGGDRLIRPALVMLFGDRAQKTKASFEALAPLRKRCKHLDHAVTRFLVGKGYVRVSSAQATSCELTNKGRKVLMSKDEAMQPGCGLRTTVLPPSTLS
jgi:hypothetical protein